MRYVALLRGINVGGNKRVEMSRLREVFTELGFQTVTTYINSGNVIFSSDKDPDTLAIETAIRAEFGFSVPTIVISEQKLRAIEKAINPVWSNNAEHRTDILFLWSNFDSASSLELIRTNPLADTLIYTCGAIIWHIDRAHYNQSKMRDFIKNPLYKQMTARNCNTVRKLVQLLEG